MIFRESQRIYRWIDAYPIVSIKDGLDENDWEGFARQTAARGQRIQIVGDDIFVTNPSFIRRGVAAKTANAVLIKLNQIGTVSETIEAIGLCREAGWAYIISRRSGETEDAFMADFAVAMGGGVLSQTLLCCGLTAKRDHKAALRFLRKAIGQHDVPEKITIDKSGANTAAIASYNAEHQADIEIRRIKYLNNIVEQDHRAVKQVVRPMMGFKSFRQPRQLLPESNSCT